MKKLSIPSKYYGYNYSHLINEISRDFFQQSPVTYFDYSRIYFDSSWLFFTSEPKISDYFIDSGLSFLPQVEITNKDSFHLIPSIEVFRSFAGEVASHFDVHHLFAYVKKSLHYVDIYWLGTHNAENETINFYFNNLDKIKLFSKYFDESASSLIKNAENEKIIIPELLTPEYDLAFQKLQLVSDNQSDSFLQSQIAEKNLTTRELECLKLIVKGFSAKMVAKKLNISSRTVERHLENIKAKYHFSSRLQLIELFSAI
jgi:LuxR family transcriptional regulator, quorum-sensing system regulator SolR